ncbi:unnamed protein product [Acanthoscelides obtectus]|uniref:Proteasome assembly chaperone 1 n=1 Tax=Acanthoscelides obtectus TaxID=200917 RepID=A0A9P0L127_ACAOB|nr:unnamed protein product [Acanthoscelides obtectus]CAK1631955.1 hypothetical protein AOBTE_LOCUS7253 [Acanthoscelides obtectus]
MSSLLFGEIVEPSTRALIEDEFDEFPEYTKPSLDYEGDFSVPAAIHSMIFIETKKIRTVFTTCMLEHLTPMCTIKNAEIEVYNFGKYKYMIVFGQPQELIVHYFHDWIIKAESIFGITSDSSGNYQTMDARSKPPSIIRKLSSNSTDFNIPNLEPPNLITGLGANVLSYCIHLGLNNCCLFVVYFDSSPLDSLSVGPLIELSRKLELPLRKSNIQVGTL